LKLRWRTGLGHPAGRRRGQGHGCQSGKVAQGGGGSQVSHLRRPFHSPQGRPATASKPKAGASDSAGASCLGSAGQGQSDRTSGQSRRPRPSVSVEERGLSGTGIPRRFVEEHPACQTDTSVRNFCPGHPGHPGVPHEGLKKGRKSS